MPVHWQNNHLFENLTAPVTLYVLDSLKSAVA